MQWTYEGKTIDTIPDEYEGFVYLITNKKILSLVKINIRNNKYKADGLKLKK